MRTHRKYRRSLPSLIVSVTILFSSCGGSDQNNSSPKQEEKSEEKGTSSIEQPSSVNSESYEKGQQVYQQTCQVCHQANGEGLPNTFPPLAQSDYLLADKIRAIKQVINGSNGEITVNGQQYNSAMPPQNLTDEQISDVLNYVFSSWGNKGEIVTVEDVKTQRAN